MFKMLSLFAIPQGIGYQRVVVQWDIVDLRSIDNLGHIAVVRNFLQLRIVDLLGILDLWGTEIIIILLAVWLFLIFRIVLLILLLFLDGFFLNSSLVVCFGFKFLYGLYMFRNWFSTKRSFFICGELFSL